MSRVLINESPVMIIPSLATKIGLNKAVVLQQIHFWLGISKHEDMIGRTWVYNSYEEWQKQLPFWSVSTIKRTIRSLEMLGLVLSDNFNQMKMDKTKWYSIDYEKVQKLEASVGKHEVTPIEENASEEGMENTEEAAILSTVKNEIPIQKLSAI
jgi:hypothetical protein